MLSDHIDPWGSGEWGTGHRGRGEAPALGEGGSPLEGARVSARWPLTRSAPALPLCLRPSCPRQAGGSCKGTCAPDLRSPGLPSAVTVGAGARQDGGFDLSHTDSRPPPWPLGFPTKPRRTVPGPSRGPSTHRAQFGLPPPVLGARPGPCAHRPPPRGPRRPLLVCFQVSPQLPGN